MKYVRVHFWVRQLEGPVSHRSEFVLPSFPLRCCLPATLLAILTVLFDDGLSLCRNGVSFLLSYPKIASQAVAVTILYKHLRKNNSYPLFC